jgi:hypothetical protein
VFDDLAYQSVMILLCGYHFWWLRKLCQTLMTRVQPMDHFTDKPSPLLPEDEHGNVHQGPRESTTIIEKL